MIKTESDNNIAVVSMDEYNKGLNAIHELEAIQRFMQTEYAENDNNKYHFIVLRNYLVELVGPGTGLTHSAVVMNDDEYQRILSHVKDEIKLELRNRDDCD